MAIISSGLDGRPRPLAGTTVRIPERASLRGQHQRRRRRSRIGLPQPARLPLAATFRLGSFGRVYVGIGALVAVVLLYLFQAAGVTQASYEIGRLDGQRQDLVAEQAHLRYQEASLRSPARIESEAVQAALARPAPYKYVEYQEANLNLDRQVPVAPDASPLWQRAVASLGRRLTAGQDAYAYGH